MKIYKTWEDQVCWKSNAASLTQSLSICMLLHGCFWYLQLVLFHECFLFQVDSDFLDTFYELIQYPLSIYDRCDDVDHCLGFVAKVCCQLCDENVAQRRTSASGQENGFESDFEEDEDELHPFVMKLFEFLIKVNHTFLWKDFELKIFFRYRTAKIKRYDSGRVSLLEFYCGI